LQKVFKLLKRKSKKIIITAIAIVFILIILTVGISVLIYKFSSTNNLANLLLQKTNLPIVVVDYKPVSYSLYLEDQRLLNEYYQEIKQIEDNSILDISKVKEQDLILENIIKKVTITFKSSYARRKNKKPI